MQTKSLRSAFIDLVTLSHMVFFLNKSLILIQIWSSDRFNLLPTFIKINGQILTEIQQPVRVTRACLGNDFHVKRNLEQRPNTIK